MYWQDLPRRDNLELLWRPKINVRNPDTYYKGRVDKPPCGIPLNTVYVLELDSVKNRKLFVIVLYKGFKIRLNEIDMLEWKPPIKSSKRSQIPCISLYHSTLFMFDADKYSVSTVRQYTEE